MSVTSIAILVLAAAAMLAMSAPVHAQAVMREKVYIIRSANQLAQEKPVRHYEEIYGALASAQVIYRNCDKDLAITQVNKDFLNVTSDSTGRDYLKAFEDTYVARTGAASSAELSQDFVRYLTDVQAQAMAGTVSVIQHSRQRCFDGRIRKIVEYVDKLRQVSMLSPAEQEVVAPSLVPPTFVTPPSDTQATPPNAPAAAAPVAAQH